MDTHDKQRTDGNGFSPFLLAFALAFAGLTARGGEPPVAADPELESIKKFVIECQKAGHERGDFETYIRQWGDEAKLVAARGPKPGQYETTLNREQIGETRRLRMLASPWKNLKLTFREISIARDGNQVVLKWTTEATHEGGKEVVSEVYTLAKTDDGWRVVENRYWPQLLIFGNLKMEFTPEMWKQLDSYIDDPPAGEEVEIADYFFSRRFQEGYQLTLERTKAADADAVDWLDRAKFAFQIGLTADALDSYRTARELDPEAPLPEFVVQALKARE